MATRSGRPNGGDLAVVDDDGLVFDGRGAGSVDYTDVRERDDWER